MSKILQVNPNLFEFSSRRRSRKRTEDDTKGGSGSGSGSGSGGAEIRVRAPAKKPTLSNKNAILKFIRDHQRRNEWNRQEMGHAGGHGDHADNERSAPLSDTSEFEDSLKYLIDIAKQVEEAPATAMGVGGAHMGTMGTVANPPHNHTLKSYGSSPSSYVQQHYGSSIAQDPWVSTVYPEPSAAGGAFRLEPPKYGCLKGGALPTYRTYYKLNTPHITSMTPRHPLASGASGASGASYPQSRHNVTQRNYSAVADSGPARVTDLVETARSAAAAPPKLIFPKQKRTVRRTFKIGKSKVHPRVSVLISNRNIRRNITTKVHDLKQVSIPDIKRFLVKRGLIRVGTAAPNDVLRKMYESATMLCGDVYNHNPDTLLYNFFNDDTAVPA